MWRYKQRVCAKTELYGGLSFLRILVEKIEWWSDILSKLSVSENLQKYLYLTQIICLQQITIFLRSQFLLKGS